jgi:DeoR family glycerol-3-phosphate regulon repressor
MKIEKRQTKLIEIVRRKEKVSVEELSALLEASRETIRRDLTQLSESGKILKVHGGAKMPRVMGEGPFKQRLSENVDAKMKIAKTAASLVEPGETLFIDTGSTTLLFVEELAKAPGLTIITNSTEIARTVATASNASRAFLLGGEFSADNSQTIGAMAATHVRSFRAHHAFLAVGAIDARSGAMDYNPEEAQIARAMIEQSETITVLADSSKFDALGSFEVCPLKAIDRLVTDTAPPPEILEIFEAGGGDVFLPI